MAPRHTVNDDFNELHFSDETFAASSHKRKNQPKATLKKKSNYAISDYEPYDDYDEDEHFDYDSDDWDVTYNPPYK